MVGCVCLFFLIDSLFINFVCLFFFAFCLLMLFVSLRLLLVCVVPWLALRTCMVCTGGCTHV